MLTPLFLGGGGGGGGGLTSERLPQASQSYLNICFLVQSTCAGMFLVPAKIVGEPYIKKHHVSKIVCVCVCVCVCMSNLSRTQTGQNCPLVYLKCFCSHLLWHHFWLNQYCLEPAVEKIKLNKMQCLDDLHPPVKYKTSWKTFTFND